VSIPQTLHVTRSTPSLFSTFKENTVTRLAHWLRGRRQKSERASTRLMVEPLESRVLLNWDDLLGWRRRGSFVVQCAELDG